MMIAKNESQNMAGVAETIAAVDVSWFLGTEEDLIGTSTQK